MIEVFNVQRVIVFRGIGFAMAMMIVATRPMNKTVVKHGPVGFKHRKVSSTEANTLTMANTPGWPNCLST